MDFDVKKIADLCHIRLNDEELARLGKDMSAILEYVKKLDSLDTESVEPTSHVLDLENVFRPDEVKKWDGRDEVLKNAPNKESTFFKVPKVVDKES